MREVKFRAWHPPTPGEPVGIMRQVRKMEMVDGGWILTLDKNLVTNIYTLMQYTGLKDKNGVEIYEGDIVETPRREFEVIFEHAAFWLRQGAWFVHIGENIGNEDLDEIYGGEMLEVIGNIYESPDLLKQN